MGNDRGGVAEPVRISGAVLGLLAALVGAVGTYATWRVFVATPDGQRVDHLSLLGAQSSERRGLGLAEAVLDTVSVSLVLVVLLVGVVVAVLRRRWVLCVQIAMVVGGANVTTQLLKHVVLDRPDLVSGLGVSGNTLPSGHSTVVASVAFASVLAVPPRWRGLVAVVAAAGTALAGVSTLIAGWHRPADAVAAVTVVLVWAGLATVVTAFLPPERGAERAASDVGSTIAVAVLVVGGAGCGLLAARALQAADTAVGAGGVWAVGSGGLAAAFRGGGVGIAAVSALAVGLFLLALRVAGRAAPRRPVAAPPTRVPAARR